MPPLFLNTIVSLFFVSSLFVSYTSIPRINKIGERFNIIDKPNFRKIHNKPIVRLGGISIFSSFIFSLFLFLFIFQFSETFQSLFNLSDIKFLLPIVLCSVVFFLIGLVDDILNLSPQVRLFFQIVSSTLLWHYGLQIRFIDFNWLEFINHNLYLENFFSLLLTVIWVVGVTNAINWFDGLDGLAAGISIIILLGFTLVFFTKSLYFFSLLTIILMGSCLGFLSKNFYPASILMGDSGSYFLGFHLSVFSLLSSINTSGSFTSQYTNYEFLTSFIFLLVPICDMTFVIFSRIINKKSPFIGDKGHLHHRLLKSGFSQINVVYLIYGLTLISVILGIIKVLKY